MFVFSAMPSSCCRNTTALTRFGAKFDWQGAGFSVSQQAIHIYGIIKKTPQGQNQQA
jgi:hypothetical protein